MVAVDAVIIEVVLRQRLDAIHLRMRETCQSASAGTDKVPAGNSPQDRQGTRINSSIIAARACRRGDRYWRVSDMAERPADVCDGGAGKAAFFRCEWLIDPQHGSMAEGGCCRRGLPADAPVKQYC